MASETMAEVSLQPQTWNVLVRNNWDLNALGATYEHATRSRYITVWLGC